MPFYFDYDLLLISVVLVLYVADRQREAAPRAATTWEDRWLPRVDDFIFALQVATIIEPYTRVHPLVPLMAVLAVMLIRRGSGPSSRFPNRWRIIPSSSRWRREGCAIHRFKSISFFAGHSGGVQ